MRHTLFKKKEFPTCYWFLFLILSGRWFLADLNTTCSATCGDGVRTRVVVCLLFAVDGVRVVDDSFCDDSEKPSAVEPCTDLPRCPGTWVLSSWTEVICSHYFILWHIFYYLNLTEAKGQEVMFFKFCSSFPPPWKWNIYDNKTVHFYRSVLERSWTSCPPLKYLTPLKIVLHCCKLFLVTNVVTDNDLLLVLLKSFEKLHQGKWISE